MGQYKKTGPTSACTNMQRAGIDVKSLQYLMGHSNVSVTLDVYPSCGLRGIWKGSLQSIDIFAFCKKYLVGLP